MSKEEWWVFCEELDADEGILGPLLSKADALNEAELRTEDDGYARKVLRTMCLVGVESKTTVEDV